MKKILQLVLALTAISAVCAAVLALVNDITQGIPAEIEARRKQYAYYRDKLLAFEERTS